MRSLRLSFIPLASLFRSNQLRLALVLGVIGAAAAGCGDAGGEEPEAPLDTASGGTQRQGTGGSEPSLGSGGRASGGASPSAGGAGGSAEDGGTGGRSSGSGGDNNGTGGDTSPDPAVTWPLINGIQWADTEGNPIQAHGGGLLKVDSDYYWFGENRNPDGTFYAVSAYRSRDLRRWEHTHDVLTMDSDPGLKPANVERPKVVYNAATHKYVMWMHWENGKDYGEARAAVASSDTVDGDYTYHGSFRPLQDEGVTDHGKPGYMSRDCTLFVDDDGKGYFISASNENYDLHLYELTEDYLNIDRRAALLFEGGHREAPALFKRGDTYFLLTSGATGWDPNQAQYATSTSLTQGWSSMKNVGDGTTFHSQSTFVQAVSGASGTQYLYLGDRWAGAWGGRVNDSTYVWQPITFSNDTTMSMSFSNNLEIDVTKGTIVGAVDAFVLENVKSGLRLATDGPGDEDGSDAVQQPADSSSPQAWRFNYDGEGYFRIATDDGGKILDVPDESEQAGQALHVWEDHGGDNQVWRLIDLGEGNYRVQNKKSGLFVGVRAGADTAGAVVEQQASASGTEQVWAIHIAD